MRNLSGLGEVYPVRLREVGPKRIRPGFIMGKWLSCTELSIHRSIFAITSRRSAVCTTLYQCNKNSLGNVL